MLYFKLVFIRMTGSVTDPLAVASTPRYFVSDAEDAARYAKDTWFSDHDRCLICTFGPSRLSNQYKAVFPKFHVVDYPSTQVIEEIVKRIGKIVKMVIILVDPPKKQEMSHLVSACTANEFSVLCHFSVVNACFDPFVNAIPEYMYDFGTPSFGKRYFIVKNTEPAKKLVKTGVYFLTTLLSDKKFDSCIEDYFMERDFVCKDPNLGPLSWQAFDKSMGNMHNLPHLSFKDPIVFLPNGYSEYLNRRMRYDPAQCPKLLLPGNLHVFMDISSDALEELQQRVASNDVLRKTSLFVCMSHDNVNLPKAKFTWKFTTHGDVAVHESRWCAFPVPAEPVESAKLLEAFVANAISTATSMSTANNNDILNAPVSTTTNNNGDSETDDDGSSDDSDGSRSETDSDDSN